MPQLTAARGSWPWFLSAFRGAGESHGSHAVCLQTKFLPSWSRREQR
jgi:hypothetical protein